MPKRQRWQKNSDEYLAVRQMWLEGYDYASIGAELGIDIDQIKFLVHDEMGYAEPPNEYRLRQRIVALYKKHSVLSVAAKLNISEYTVRRIIWQSGGRMHRAGWRESMKRVR